jgi:YD repeat-containing protein
MQKLTKKILKGLNIWEDKVNELEKFGFINRNLVDIKGKELKLLKNICKIKSFKIDGNKIILCGINSNQPVTFTFDDRDNVIKWQQKGGSTYIKTYDEKSRLIHNVDNDGCYTKLTYDEKGDLILTDYNGVFLHKCKYDENHNIIEEEEIDLTE